MDARNNIATDLFYKIRSRFTGLKLGTDTGEITISPEDARFFDFDYMEGEMPIGHVSISLAEPNSMKVYFSTGITESMNTGQKNNWYAFLKELRVFAKRRLLNFDTRDIAKDNLDKRDYAFLTQNAQSKPVQQNIIQQPVGESIMAESAMYGSKNMSYQKLMDTRLIIKHSQAVMDDTQPGARTRNISALFVENQDGERFKYPFIHLAGARAMQRHVANGGLPYDDIGKSLIQMSEEIAQLKSFSNYVVRNDLMNTGNGNIVERSQQQLNNLREQIKALSKQSHYENYRESFQPQETYEVPDEVVEDYTERFTIKNFKEDIKNVFPVIYRLMKESDLGYGDIVSMTQEEQVANEDLEVSSYDEFDKFESWVMNLGEESNILSQDPEEQSLSIQNLQSLVGEHFPAGVDGTNAIESLKGIIEDPELFKQIKEQAKQDPDSCVRGLVKDWLANNAPEVLEQLDFGDYVDEPVPAQGESMNTDLSEARGFDLELEYETESAIVEFQQAQDGTAQITKVSIGKADITSTIPPEVLADLASEIEPGETSPINGFYLIVDLGIDYSISGSYQPATWGYHGGSPEEYPEIDDATVSVTGNGTSVEINSEDLGPDAVEYIDQKIYADAESGADDYDGYDDRYESADQGPNKSDVPAAQRKAKGGDWKVNTKDLDDEKTKSPTSSAGLARKKKELGMESQGMNVQEVAEFIHSFYDKEAGTFPKGPEGVCTMVGKKFGEQAEQIARKFVERMAPQQTDPQIQELARIKQLSGM